MSWAGVDAGSKIDGVDDGPDVKADVDISQAAATIATLRAQQTKRFAARPSSLELRLAQFVDRTQVDREQLTTAKTTVKVF
jgi:hypothetical protein